MMLISNGSHSLPAKPRRLRCLAEAFAEKPEATLMMSEATPPAVGR